MRPPSNSLRGYWLTLAIGTVVLALAAAIYAHLKNVPAAIAFPVGLAFLVEFPFYLLPGFAAPREHFLAQGKSRAATLFALSAIAPWLIYATGTGHFTLPAFVVMASVAVLMCFWYPAFPANPVVDLLYLCLFAAIILLKVFARTFPMPWPKIETSVLGHVMLVRCMAFSFMALRGKVDADYRFMPTKCEWLAGLRWFGILIVPTAAAYYALGLFALRQPHPMNIGLTAGTFFGILWLTALSEEFIFRGLLLPWLERATKSPAFALIVSSILFGAIHLSFHFHGTFPNWRFCIVAGIMGFFCGMARRQTGGIQAGMVAHALTVAVWKMFLQ